jgi:hypothetical protein
MRGTMNSSVIADCAAACICSCKQRLSDPADRCGTEIRASQQNVHWISAYLMQPRRSYAEYLSDRQKQAS